MSERIDLNEREWAVKHGSTSKKTIKAYKFIVQGESIIFQRGLGSTNSVFVNVAAYPSKNTVVTEKNP